MTVKQANAITQCKVAGFAFQNQVKGFEAQMHKNSTIDYFAKFSNGLSVIIIGNIYVHLLVIQFHYFSENGSITGYLIEIHVLEE